jgi:hypothetical protein
MMDRWWVSAVYKIRTVHTSRACCHLCGRSTVDIFTDSGTQNLPLPYRGATTKGAYAG